jgi:hypothetical protein
VQIPLIKKNMKRGLWYSWLSAGMMFVLSSVCFFSCEKNDVDPSGSVSIKVVNATSTEGVQSFTLVNKVLISGGLDFTDASDYMTTNSGTRLVAEFKDEGTNNVSATGELYMDDGSSFTIYLVGSGSSARVQQYKDNLSAPASDKVKVKFIHLSDAAPSNIDIKDSDGETIVSNLTINIESGYSTLDPGTLSLQLYNTVSRNSIGTFDVPDLVGGKIYTIYTTGSTDATVSVQKVLHN